MNDVTTQPARLAVRASDAEREQTVALLQRSFADGRLTQAELEERAGAAYAGADQGPATRSHRRPARRRAAAATAGHGPGPAPAMHPVVRPPPGGPGLLAAISISPAKPAAVGSEPQQPERRKD